MRTPRLPVVDWTDATADLNGLVRFAERRNLVSTRVPSHFNWPLPGASRCNQYDVSKIKRGMPKLKNELWSAQDKGNQDSENAS